MKTRIFQKLCTGTIAMFLLYSLATSEAVRAQGTETTPIGIGVLLGEPTGLTLKIFTNPWDAVNFEIGDSYFGLPRLQIDYLIHSGDPNSGLRLYAGPGLAIGFNNNGRTFLYGSDGSGLYRTTATAFGARFVLGLELVPRPFEMFMEGAPLIGLSPGFGAAFDFAIGMRVYL